MLPPGVNDPADNHVCVGGDGMSHFASSGLASSEPVNAYSPELSSRPAAPEGRSTRIEIAFEKLKSYCTPIPMNLSFKRSLNEYRIARSGLDCSMPTKMQ